MKLKTLKDLMVYGSGFTFVGTKSKSFPYPMFREVDLKQEAIKWVKKLINDELKDAPQISRRDNRIGDLASAAWIKNFFNITEEDLK